MGLLSFLRGEALMNGTKKTLGTATQSSAVKRFKTRLKNLTNRISQAQLSTDNFLKSSIAKFPDLQHRPLIQQWLVKFEQQLRENYQDNEIDHAIEWLLQYKKQDLVLTLGPEKVVNSSKRWTKLLIEKAANLVEQDHDVAIILNLDNNYKIVKLLNENAYKYEGREMGHCVASYANKKTTIYSLRDGYNKPHATMEINGKDIVQLQGKQNNAIKTEYIQYVIEAVSALGLNVNDNYLTKLGFSEIDNKLKEFLQGVYKEDNLPLVTFNKKLYLNHHDKFWNE